MPTPFSQQARMGRLTTVLGKDVLNLVRMDAVEHVNALFQFRIEAIADTPAIDFNQLIGTHATVHLRSFDLPETAHDGVIAEAELLGAVKNGWRYALTLRPWFWLLSLRRKQQIFHNMTVVAILDEIFEPWARKVDKRLATVYPVIEYTVQYRESDFAFACRMMECFGISYHFIHKDGSHVLVLTDTADSHDAVVGATRPLRGLAASHQSDVEHFWQMNPSQRLQTGRIRLTDYNFKTPDAAMETVRSAGAPYAEGDIEGYDYPGGYGDQATGRRVAGLRIDAAKGQDPRHRAIGNCASLRAGMTVDVVGDQRSGVGKSLCLSARHSFHAGGYGTEGNDDEGYEGQYLLMPVNTPLRPEIKTARAVVQGPQTAKVVGNGEIDCDEYGRILVRFHWDLGGRYSMRCRVSQNWAGKGWGGMVIPRIGMEVVVEFLEGDPDKPLVTGCVYNGKNDVPYPLPQHKTRSTFKTDTHKGEGFNELMFEDEKDEELIFMHGQKDQRIQILNDRAKSIGRDQSEAIGRDKSITVGQDHTETVGRDARQTVGRDVMYDVGQNQQEKYGKDHIHVVGNIHKQDVFADHLTKVGRNGEHTVLGRYTLDVNQSITTNTKTHTLMAGDKFVIAGPGGKITIDSSGITLEAAKIDLKGAVTMGGSGSSQVPTLQGAANAGLPLVEECLAQKDKA